MFKLLLFAVPSLFLKIPGFSQTPIDVADNTIKIGSLGEEFFYYAFAAGDQVIFNFEEVKGKELKEVEILEYPATSKFLDFKPSSIKDKVLRVPHAGIYKFRFSNGAMGGRICHITIQRIPSSDATADFNTSVYWKTVYDTTYTMEQERYLISRDTAFVNVAESVAKVHSSGNLNGNKTTVNFMLPQHTVAWSYYLGVDQAGQTAYEEATNKLARESRSKIMEIAEFSPGAAIILQIMPYITRLQHGEDIDYYLTDADNASLFISGQGFRYYKQSKVINDFARMEAPLSGMMFFCLSNDNAVTGVEVALHITAMTVTERWGTRPYQKMHIQSREVAYWN